MEFKKPLKQIEKRLGIEADVEGYSVMPLNAADETPVSVKVFQRATEMLGPGSYFSMTHRFRIHFGQASALDPKCRNSCLLRSFGAIKSMDHIPWK